MNLFPTIRYAVRGTTYDAVQIEAEKIAQEFFGHGWAVSLEWELGQTRIERVETMDGETVSLLVGPFEFDVSATPKTL